MPRCLFYLGTRQAVGARQLMSGGVRNGCECRAEAGIPCMLEIRLESSSVWFNQIPDLGVILHGGAACVKRR